jgi:RES domain-containing protein
VVLLVPSAVNPRERNVLLNPSHPDIAHLSIELGEPFSLDRRLLSN